MKFAVGYFDGAGGESISEVAADYRDGISEVYFPWPGQASGRPGRLYSGFAAQERLESELVKLRGMGIKLDLLLNANCYGADAVSLKLERTIEGILERLDSLGLLPETVTTASPFIAEYLAEAVPKVERRASVNMRIGTSSAVDYLDGRFNSVYVCRDIQRDIERMRSFSEHCRRTGIGVCMLANSGCLRNCPAQTFHDNYVAHSDEAEYRIPGGRGDPTICWSLYSLEERRENFLRGSWIRPEDIQHYEGLVDVVKLATRQHDRPRTVIAAYTSGKFRGNLAALMEPNFSSLFGKDGYIDNDRFPEDWFGTAGSCADNCRHCGRCSAVWKSVYVRVPPEPGTDM